TFHYSNHPAPTRPALVEFVTKTHTGYCQYFAGAMALMLRYLGIPSHVAVGFAGGAYDPDRDLWNVSDPEAPAWGGVGFKGYGWLPFDPTPTAPGAALRRTQAGLPAAGRGAGGSSSSARGALTPGPHGVSAFEYKLSENNGFGSNPQQRHHGPESDLP